MIEQEPFCGVRTHFYYNASSYDIFRDRRVVEPEIPTCSFVISLQCLVGPLPFRSDLTSPSVEYFVL